MQLSIILLIAVSILTILSGISVLAGAKKGERKDAYIFFFATFFATFPKSFFVTFFFSNSQ